MPFKLLSPQPYKEIKEMVIEFNTMMKKISAALPTAPGSPKLELDKEPIGFYLKPADIERMIGTISTLTDFSQYLALFGIDKEFGNLTICIVGADESGNVVKQYKMDDSTPGEEKWPLKTKLTLAHTASSLDDFLKKI
jgi:hypothetical protein